MTTGLRGGGTGGATVDRGENIRVRKARRTERKLGSWRWLGGVTELTTLEVGSRMPLFGPLAATTQFYLYGRRHCTATGWHRASAQYDLGMLETADLRGRTFMVTGANSGIGRCLSDYLANRGASLYMVCRNEARAEVALREVRALSGNDKVHTLIGDCSLATDVRRVMQEFGSRESQLDGLVCNAGAITPTKTVTPEGYEVTLAAHLLHGSYLLATLAMPHLRRAAEPRVLFVSSGGMYNTPWPGWATANDAPAREYNQEMAYAYAKRGQARLCTPIALLCRTAPRLAPLGAAGAAGGGVGERPFLHRHLDRELPSWLGGHPRRRRVAGSRQGGACTAAHAVAGHGGYRVALRVPAGRDPERRVLPRSGPPAAFTRRALPQP